MDLVGGWVAAQCRDTFEVGEEGWDTGPLVRLRLAALDQLPRVDPERRLICLAIGHKAEWRVALLEHRRDGLHTRPFASHSMIWLTIAEEYLADIGTRAKFQHTSYRAIYHH